jgi:hypothetical protein
MLLTDPEYADQIFLAEYFLGHLYFVDSYPISFLWIKRLT